MPEPADNKPSLIDEFKRRNVFRVGVAYAVMSWLVIQVADIAVPTLRFPDWVSDLVLFLLALGFLPTLFFAWAFELTPEGIKREKDVDRDESITQETGKKLNTVTLIALALVVAIVALDRVYVHDHGETLQETRSSDEVSIAVLPFADMSPNGDQEYFSDGITEEILNGLAKLRTMKVAGRTSSFAFKGRNENLRDIGEALGVQHVLEGSVRKDGNRLRITAQLVKVSDGFHLWSETYDRQLEDVFAVQDEISAAIVGALQGSLLGGTSAEPRRAEVDVATYERYLAARKLIWNRTNEDLLEARAILEELVDASPNFVPGLTSLAETVLLLRSDSFYSYGNLAPEESRRIATPLLDRAIELDPNSADAWAVRGLMFNSDLQFAEGEAALLMAVELNPSLSNAWNWLGNSVGSQQRVGEGMEYLRRAAEVDPLWLVPNSNLARQNQVAGRIDETWEIIERLRPFNQESATFHALDGEMRQSVGDLADANRALHRAYELSPDTPSIGQRYAFNFMDLLAFDKALEVVPPHFAPLQNIVTGEWDAALPRLKAAIDANPMNLLPHFIYTTGANYVGDFEGIAEVYDTHIKSPQWFADMGVEFLSHNYITAMDKLGRESDRQELLEFAAAALAVRAAEGESNDNYYNDLATYQALAGDFDAGLETLNRSIDVGERYAFWQYYHEFNPVMQDPRMIAIKQRNLELINSERVKLGWEPVAEVGIFLELPDPEPDAAELPRPVL